MKVVGYRKKRNAKGQRKVGITYHGIYRFSNFEQSMDPDVKHWKDQKRRKDIDS